MAGVSNSHLQRLAANGCIPDSSRTAGGHWRIEDTEKVRQWATERKKTRDLQNKALGKKFKQGPQMRKSTGGGIDNAIPHVNRLCVFRRSLEDAGWFDEVDEEMLYSLHKDLLPVVEFHAYVGAKILDSKNFVIADEFREDIKGIYEQYQQ
jgi:hypothetical protein